MVAQSIDDCELPPLEEVDGITREHFDTVIRPAGKPVILRNCVGDWPAIAAGQGPITQLADFLKAHDAGAATPTFIARPEVKGRYFYTDDMSRFTFEKRDGKLSVIIDQLLAQSEVEHPAGIYAGASPTSDSMPRFAAENPMPLLDESVVPKVWISNSATIAPHFDTSENIACLVSGERSFVLFPPEQIANLYVGPIDYNMAGQPASMVDLEAIDLERFPKFEHALATAKIAKLEPGDAIYIPSLWWHRVKSHGPLNVLVNYWWHDQKNGSPMNVLALALFVMRDLPPTDRAAWEKVFNHYIFDENAPQAVEHIPPQYRGVLGDTSPERDGRIKNFLISQLSAILR